MVDSDDMNDRQVERITARYKGLKPGETAVLLREKYTRRREAIANFTEKLVRDGAVDDAEVVSLRAVGVTEEEIQQMIEKFGPK